MRYYVVPEKVCNNNEWEALSVLLGNAASCVVAFDVKEPPEKGTKRISEREVCRLLTKLGVRPNWKGCQYLRTAVRICQEDKEELDGITKRLYPSVARQHKVNAERVEHDIRHTIEVSWRTGDEQTQREVFGYSFHEGRRPTNSEFIVGLLDYLERGEFTERTTAAYGLSGIS